MTVSFAAVTGRVLEIGYLYRAVGCQISLRAACMYDLCEYTPSKRWVDKALMTDWLHSAVVCRAENSRHENSRPLYNVHPRLLHAHLGEKVQIISKIYGSSFCTVIALLEFCLLLKMLLIAEDCGTS